MKNRRRTRFTRDTYFHVRTCGTCIRDRPHERRNAHVHRANARGASHTIPSTDWRDGTLHPRHARRDTGCPSRSAADWRVQAVIGRL